MTLLEEFLDDIKVDTTKLMKYNLTDNLVYYLLCHNKYHIHTAIRLTEMCDFFKEQVDKDIG